MVLPWYRELKYEGVDISGTWVALQTSPDDPARLEMHLEQHAHALSGTMTIQQGLNFSDLVTVSVSGTLWEGYATLNYRSLNRQRLSFATSLIFVRYGGQELVGEYVYRSLMSDSIESEPVVWMRKEDPMATVHAEQAAALQDASRLKQNAAASDDEKMNRIARSQSDDHNGEGEIKEVR